jgi:RNA polymerase sigma-70 factor (ECF subfamily)
MTDELIMQKILDKDPEAFNEVYNKLYRKLFLFANSLIGNTEEARDIVADSFIKFWSKENYYSNMTHLQVYFYTIIKNSCIDYLRKDKLKTKVENRLVQSKQLSENIIEKKFQEAELIQLLYDKINQLPDRMQQVFKLTYLDGFSRTEVAQMLNLSENTIRNTNAAAMKTLRLTFGEQVMTLIFITIFVLQAS